MAPDRNTIAFRSLRRDRPDFLTQEARLIRKSPNSHRGLLNNSGHVLRPCTLSFLYKISLELLRARAFAYVSSTTSDLDFLLQLKRCRLLKHEIARLIQFPELFPSTVVKGRFLALLAADGEISFVTACKGLLVERTLTQWDKDWRAKTRPFFAPDSEGWENFFLDGACGAGIEFETTEPKSANQIVSGVGLRIMADLERTEAAFHDYVQMGLFNLGMGTPMTDTQFDFSEKKGPKVDQLSTSLRGYMPPLQDWLKPKSDYVRPGAQPITELPAIIGQLDRQPGINQMPLITPTSWSAMVVESWHTGKERKVVSHAKRKQQPSV